LLAFFAAFFLVAMLTILPSIVHGSCNDLLLRLIECIESLKSEVKQKMNDALSGNRVRKSRKFAISLLALRASKFHASRVDALRAYRTTEDEAGRGGHSKLRNLETFISR
jgi:hypothetical protein